jgi:hypothetical protein
MFMGMTDGSSNRGDAEQAEAVGAPYSFVPRANAYIRCLREVARSVRRWSDEARH